MQSQTGAWSHRFCFFSVTYYHLHTPFSVKQPSRCHQHQLLKPASMLMRTDFVSMAKQYSGAALKKIGEQCGHKLPPASAVQAMFMYEMQRESELERLFQGHLFKLARLDDNSKTLQSRVSELSTGLNNLRNDVDAQTAALRKEITSKEVCQLESIDCLPHMLNRHRPNLG